MLSVVIPAYNEEKMIHRAAEEVTAVLSSADIPFEILFVNDGSRDGTWPAIQQAAAQNSRVRGVCFSRNFGKEAAMTAGLSEARGDCAVVIDCDLQHPVEIIPQMYQLWLQGYEVVEGVKASRGKESGLHAFAAKSFYRIISKAVKIDMSRASDFKLLDRRAVNSVLSLGEKHAFFRALSSWVGYKTTQISYDVKEREVGESKWSTRSLITYAITNITSFSSAPLLLPFVFGGLFLLFGLVFLIVSLCRPAAASGYAALLVVLVSLGFGLLLLAVGVVGYYLDRVYTEAKGRPRFIISERVEHHVD